MPCSQSTRNSELRPGDRVVAVADRPVKNWEEFYINVGTRATVPPIPGLDAVGLNGWVVSFSLVASLVAAIVSSRARSVAVSADDMIRSSRAATWRE